MLYSRGVCPTGKTNYMVRYTQQGVLGRREDAMLRFLAAGCYSLLLSCGHATTPTFRGRFGGLSAAGEKASRTREGGEKKGIHFRGERSVYRWGACLLLATRLLNAVRLPTVHIFAEFVLPLPVSRPTHTPRTRLSNCCLALEHDQANVGAPALSGTEHARTL